MFYIPEATALLFRTSVNLGIYLRVETAPVLRLWSGVTSIDQTMPPIHTAPETYLPLRMVAVPELDAIVNQIAERAEITLEGISVDAADEIAGLDPDVIGCQVNLGFAAHDSNWQPATAILSFAEGVSDFWSMAQPPVQGSANPTRNLSLSVGFGETGRKRPRRIAYSDTQQQFRYPGDTFCRDVPRYHRGFQLAWPRF
jgi:hypothetical protein